MLAEPLNPWESRENAQNRKEFLAKEKGKEIQKGKEKKIRVARLAILFRATPPVAR